MRISKRQLLSLIREQQELITEQQKFERMLLKEEGELGAMAKMAFEALKSLGDKLGPMLTQWLKSNPEMLDSVIKQFVEDEKVKKILMTAVDEYTAKDAEAETETATGDK